MHKILLSFFTLITLGYTIAQNKEATIQSMYNDINYLASDKLKGRKTGTIGEKKAAKYISRQFEKYNLLPKGDIKYYQKFKGKIQHHHSKESRKSIKGYNVIGFCDNNQKETIIIGAHYDHLGKGGAGSLHSGKKEIHNGADDNASGVSILINLIKKLSENKYYNYLFIAFSGEEEGLLGSSHFVKNPTINLKDVKFMLNLDMVGRLNQKKELAINGVGTSTKWNNLLKNTNISNLKLITSESGVGPSDHTPFYLENIPVLHFFTGQHLDYHKPTDDIEKINFEGMYIIMKYIESIIEESTKITNFDFQETTQETTIAPKMNVTLGIMPDYLFDGNGLRIDGVTKGKTAFKHGFKKGDIITFISDVKINNIMDYMKGLNKFEKGDKTTIKIIRNNKIISKSVVFK